MLRWFILKEALSSFKCPAFIVVWLNCNADLCSPVNCCKLWRCSTSCRSQNGVNLMDFSKFNEMMGTDRHSNWLHKYLVIFKKRCRKKDQLATVYHFYLVRSHIHIFIVPAAIDSQRRTLWGVGRYNQRWMMPRQMPSWTPRSTPWSTQKMLCSFCFAASCFIIHLISTEEVVVPKVMVP